MRLRDHVSRELVFVSQGAPDKRAFLEQVVGLVHDCCAGVAREELLQRLLQREEQVTTGIGHGVAIPHAMVGGLDRPRCVVVQTPQGQDYESLDNTPVHIFFILLSPPGATGTHIRLLARVARLVDRDAFVTRVATAASADEVLQLILEEDERHV